MYKSNPLSQLKGRARPFALALLAATFIGSGCELVNNPPLITIVPDELFPLTGSTQTFRATVNDADEDIVRITWAVSGGTLSKTSGPEVLWTAPLDRGSVVVKASADDRKGGKDSTSVTLVVVNDAPEIIDFSSSANSVLLGNTIELTVNAIDADGEEMEYSFFTSPAGVGTFSESSVPSKHFWTAPTVEETPFARSFDIVTKVKDVKGFFSTDTLSILVFSEYGTVWIADSRQARVAKYSDRGDFILNAVYAFTKPVAVANNTFADYGVYVADGGTGQVIKIGSQGEFETVYNDMPNISDMELHRDTGTLWVLSYGDSALTVINTLTESVIKKVYGFYQPQVIKINQTSGDVWIADLGLHTIFQFDANLPASDLIATLPDTITTQNTTRFGGPSTVPSLNTPSDISMLHLTSLNSVVYIADKNDSDGQIEKLTFDNTIGRYTFGSTINNIAKPTLVAATADGRVWVANSFGIVSYFTAGSNGSDKITAISYDFNNPQMMTPDPVTGEVWIGDNGTNEVIKMVYPDSVDVVISGFGFLEDLVINK